MGQEVAPGPVKAHVGWVGDKTRWVSHTERSEEDPTAESTIGYCSEAEAVAWARERTDWVLVVTDPLQWAGSPDKQPPDVHHLWQEQD